MSMMATTPTLMKTRAEIGLAEQFERIVASLPGGSKVQALRRAAMARFAEIGLPHRRIEEWKYTDLRALVKEAAAPVSSQPAGGDTRAASGPLGHVDAVTYTFVDGRFVDGGGHARLAGVVVDTLAATLESAPEMAAMAVPAVADAGTQSIAALNSALFSDGAIIRIAAGARPERPIHLVLISTGMVAVRNHIVACAGSEATVIESHISAGQGIRQENAMSQVTVGDGAVLHHAARVEAAAGSVHLGHTIAALGKAAIYKPFQLTVGDGLVRQQFSVVFQGEHASFDFGAVTLARGNGHADTTMEIQHVAPNCTSRELFKTVLDGNGRAIFQGKVIVDRLAQKTDGKQMAKALMLSPTAEFDSKPELEIYADDVACGHGSTCAEINPDLVFYCRSRGIPEAQARALLIESFVGEAIDKIDNPEVRRAFSEIAMAWLAAKPG